MSAHDDRHIRRQGADATHEREHIVGLEGVHCGYADEVRPKDAHVMIERFAETEIGEHDTVPLRFERRSDALHAERFDAKNGLRPKRSLPGTGRNRRIFISMKGREYSIPAVASLVAADRSRCVSPAFYRTCGRALRDASSVEGIRRLSFDTDILSLLPEDGRVIQSFKTFVSRFGNLDQLYVVFTAPEGHTISEYSDDVDGWVEALRAAPELERVDAGVFDRSRDLSWLANRQLLLLPPPALTQALQRFSPDGARDAVAASRELLAVPSPDVANVIRQDPLRLFEILRDSVGGTGSGLNIGASPDGIVTADGRARLVIARPRRLRMTPPLPTRSTAGCGKSRRRGKPGRHRAPSSSTKSRCRRCGSSSPRGHRIAVETEAIVRSESI